MDFVYSVCTKLHDAEIISLFVNVTMQIADVVIK